MATPVSIAIRRAEALGRVQQAGIELAAKYGVGAGNLSPRHKQPELREVVTLEAIAEFMELLASAEPVPVKKRKGQATE